MPSVIVCILRRPDNSPAWLDSKFDASVEAFFPVRYDKRHGRHRVIFAYGARVKRLRDLLESGEPETPRDRRPCVLKIHGFGRSHKWLIFNFTVRGFTILGCRWRPDTGSIQLPVTFTFDDNRSRYQKKAVVCAYGAHIDRLREYLETHLSELSGRNEIEAAA